MKVFKKKAYKYKMFKHFDVGEIHRVFPYL